jgi:hypothetical protein
MNSEIIIGSRVLVYDGINFVNDKLTPYHFLMKPATIVNRYGKISPYHGNYPDLVDVIFDERPNEISKGHFTDRVKILEEELATI